MPGAGESSPGAGTGPHPAGAVHPPRGLHAFGGAGEYLAVGTEVLGHLVDVGGLTPDDDLAAIGSGIDRIAPPLSRHLGPSGSKAGVNRSSSLAG
jgi:hypothetical protein